MRSTILFLISPTLMDDVATNLNVPHGDASTRPLNTSIARTKLQLSISSNMHGLAGVRRHGRLPTTARM